MVLSKEQILQADDLKTEVVEVPEWDGEVLLRELRGRERDAFEEGSMDKQRNVSMKNMRARLVAISAIDEEGERLFNAMCEKLEEDGIETVRTMIARADHLNMSFFRAQGMMAGPFIELEKPVAWKFEHED